MEKIEVGEQAERYSRAAEQEIVIRCRGIGVVVAFAEEAGKTAEQRPGRQLNLLSAWPKAHGS